MSHKSARWLFFLTLILLGFGLVNGPIPPLDAPAGRAWAGTTRTQTERVVFLGGGLVDENLISFTANVAASGHPGVVLLDTPNSSAHTRAFLERFGPERVIPVGSFPEGITDLERRLGRSVAPLLAWKRGRPAALWQALFPTADRVVVCPAEPRALLLQAACLAGTVKAPLFVVRHETESDEKVLDELRHWTAIWRTREILAVGPTTKLCRGVPETRLIRLRDDEAVTDAYLKHLLKKGKVHTFVVANPADTRRYLGCMSTLAPWLAVQRRAVLLLTNDAGDNTTAVVHKALRDPRLEEADTLLLLADLRAIPMERRPNPIAGKDSHIEMEPLTPTGHELFTFATGRMFNQDPGVIALQMARHRLLPPPGTPRKALVASNPGGSLPLLEAFSKYTTRELRNCGYETTALFGDDVNKADVRAQLPEHDIFLWEGHHNTLIRDYGFPEWNEPLPPSFVFLQSCLALTEPKVQPLLQRGSIAVVGSSTRTYSASGGAFSLAFFDAFLYEQQSLGGSLRQAKNFLLTYCLLKEKRLGPDAKLSGANLRSAWAFTLWGDPTLRLPAPEMTTPQQSPVCHQVRGNTIVVALPDATYDRVVTAKYQAHMRPNARMAGLITKESDRDGKRLVPFVFAEVHLPRVPSGKTPRLKTRLPEQHWVFCWDARRRCGYLLITPRPRDQRELRFHIDWEPIESVEASY